MEISKNNWELARLKALKEEEELRAEFEDDEMLYTYARDDNQVKKKGKSSRKSSGSKPEIQPSRKTRRSGGGGGGENEGQKTSAHGGINGVEKAKSPSGRSSSVKVDRVTKSPPLRINADKTPASSPIKSPAISPTRTASLLNPRKTEAADGSKNASKTSPLSVAIPKICVAKATVQSPLSNNHVGLRTRKLSSPNSAQSSTNVSPKEKPKPPVLQAWSKPHLVIRTRRASLQQMTETNKVATKVPISPNLSVNRVSISPNPVVSRVPILPNLGTNADTLPISTTEVPKAEAMPSPTARLTKAQIISSLKAAIAGHRRSMSAKEGSKNDENDICNAR